MAALLVLVWEDWLVLAAIVMVLLAAVGFFVRQR